jgi:E3 ubiquitin-protein ligase listerin
MLSPWAYSFGRLVMDTNRSVRAQACLAMGAIATAAGRNMAPFIKFVYPYWLLAQHDVSNEVVTAAASSLQATFPGNKAADALLFCRNEVGVFNISIINVSFNFGSDEYIHLAQGL